jgi:DNA-directed RNA polymerase omega subunit
MRGMSSKEFCKLLEVKILMTSQNVPPDSRFAYVVIAARRARQLMVGASPLVASPHSVKPTRVAMEELQHSVLEYDVPALAGGESEEESKKRKG